MKWILVLQTWKRHYVVNQCRRETNVILILLDVRYCGISHRQSRMKFSGPMNGALLLYGLWRFWDTSFEYWQERGKIQRELASF